MSISYLNFLCMFPIQYPQVWEMYKKAKAFFWTADKEDLSQDQHHWESLTADELHFVKHVLAFFVASDGIVVENLAGCFKKDVQVSEARAFYGFQIDGGFENLAGFETYINYSKEKSCLFCAIDTIPCVERKASCLCGRDLLLRELLRHFLVEEVQTHA